MRSYGKYCQPYPIVRLHDAGRLLCNHRDMICTGDIDKEEEANEIPIIMVSNTVVDPRTVMVLGKNESGSK
jgi:hypothetical protein